MKRIVIALSITMLAALAFAGAPQRRMFIHDMQAENGELATALGLSADQKVQWDAIHQQLDATVRPLHEQIQAAHEQLHALADSSNPDATTVGRQFLSIVALEKQIKTAHDSTKKQVDALLTPDQKTKLESLHHGMEHGPMMMHMRHPEPGSRE